MIQCQLSSSVRVDVKLHYVPRIKEKVVTLVNEETDFEEKGNEKTSSSFARSEVIKFLPQDLLSKITIFLQDSGYVTISPRDITRPEWDKLNESVNRMGGIWVSGHRSGHWSIPYSRLHE